MLSELLGKRCSGGLEYPLIRVVTKCNKVVLLDFIKPRRVSVVTQNNVQNTCALNASFWQFIDENASVRSVTRLAESKPRVASHTEVSQRWNYRPLGLCGEWCLDVAGDRHISNVSLRVRACGDSPVPLAGW